MSHKILVIDDEHRMRRILQLLLEEKGYTVKTAEDGMEGLALWKRWQPDAVLTDIKMPRADGMKVLEFKNREMMTAPLIILTAFGTIDRAVAAIKQGAYDYLTKPFNNEKVVQVVRRAITESRKTAPGTQSACDRRTMKAQGLVGASAALEEVRQDIAMVAGTRTSVLITGESGTGKEVVARAIHLLGSRKDQPFVRVNCSAIPKDLLESELFGHKIGAFTGAVNHRQGSFIGADGGIIFLDEIADLPIHLQPKLLHAVEEKSVTPIGAGRAEKVDVKVISATNRDLGAMVDAGTFRRDLYFRLNTFHIHLPPLRERPEDIDALAPYFLHQYAEEFNKEEPRLNLKTVELLKRYCWPGNVRELRNLMERLALSCSGPEIRQDDIPETIREAVNGVQSDSARTQMDLDAQQRRLIESALEKTGGNQVRAAKLLNISRNTLRYRIKKYRIP